jgi:hypothetical protein
MAISGMQGRNTQLKMVEIATLSKLKSRSTNVLNEVISLLDANFSKVVLLQIKGEYGHLLQTTQHQASCNSNVFAPS